MTRTPEIVPTVLGLDSRVFVVKLILYGGFIFAGTWFATHGSWYSYGVAVVVLGAMFAHGVELQHQCLHNTAFRSKRINRIVGRLVGLPMLVSFSEYQASHLRHHRLIGTPNDRESFNYEYARLNRPVQFLMHFFMLRYYAAKMRMLARSILPARGTDLRAARILAEYRVMLGVLALAVTSSIVWNNYAILTCWLVPLFLIAAPLHTLIELPEHVGCRAGTTDVRQNTRTIAAGRFAQWLTNGNNFHVEHHWHAGIQVEHWPQVHQVLRGEIAFLEESYLAFYQRFIAALRAGRVNDSTYWNAAHTGEEKKDGDATVLVATRSK